MPESDGARITLRELFKIEMDNLNQKLDRIEAGLKSSVDDHEERIRCLEKGNHNQNFWNAGLSLAQGIMAAIFVALGIKPQ